MKLSKKRISDIQKLEMENQQMEQRLLQFKHKMEAQKVARQNNLWNSAQIEKGSLFKYGYDSLGKPKVSRPKLKSG
jgi:cell shape-determining protein MreC